MLDHMTDAQVYALGLSIVAVALALLIGVVVWPIGDKPVDRGGFR